MGSDQAANPANKMWSRYDFIQQVRLQTDSSETGDVTEALSRYILSMSQMLSLSLPNTTES